MKSFCLWMGMGILLLSQTSCVSTLLGEMSTSENKWAQLWAPQNNVVGGNKPKDLKKKSKISIEVAAYKAPNPNIYRRIPNEFIIKMKGAEDKDLEVTVSSGVIRRVAPHRYICVPKRETQMLELIVTNIKTKEFTGKSYVVQDPPPPNVFIGLAKKDAWGAAAFQQQTVLSSEYTHDLGLDKQINCNCSAFNLVYAPLDSQRMDIANKGSKFSPEVIEVIKKAKQGDVYIFDQIINSCSSEPMRLVYIIE
ncbi:MAG: hypothetical protein GY810_19205 [Aureispira sp.]|nr:hypothetical protein [Aureispira sp.]